MKNYFKDWSQSSRESAYKIYSRCLSVNWVLFWTGLWEGVSQNTQMSEREVEKQLNYLNVISV